MENQVRKQIAPNLFQKELTSFATEVQSLNLRATFKNSRGRGKRQIGRGFVNLQEV